MWTAAVVFASRLKESEVQQLQHVRRAFLGYHKSGAFDERKIIRRVTQFDKITLAITGFMKKRTVHQK